MRNRLASLISPETPFRISVTKEDRVDYEDAWASGSREEATSPENFRFDILGTPKSLWNKSAARVFAKSMIDCYGWSDTIELFDGICHAFTAHLETIIRAYKRSLESPEWRARHEADDRRRSRKYQVLASLLLL